MDVVSDLAALKARPRSLAIGTFDGVHIGHQRVVRTAVDQAALRGLVAAVLTFDHHPLSVVAPTRQPRLLTPLRMKTELIAELGVEELVVLPFDRNLASMQPPDFCRELLRKRLDAKVVVIGENFTFAAGGSGRAGDLAECGDASGFETITVALVRAGGRPISSSRIRTSLQEGDLAEVRAILGRPPRTVGTIVHGFERGRALGFPTANIEAETGTMFPGRGVYAARALVSGRWYRAAVNVGHNPTFVHRGDETGIVHVEAYLLNFDGDIYGTAIRLDFIAKIRDERSFEYVDNLVAQMGDDIAFARRLADPAFGEVGLSAISGG